MILKAMPQQTKWFDNVKSQIKSPLFTYSADWKTGGGTWDFGVIDQTRYTGNITYLPLSSGGICPWGYWGIDGVGVVINGKSYQHSDCISIGKFSIFNAIMRQTSRLQIPAPHTTLSTPKL